jgi:hypothetical protein
VSESSSSYGVVRLAEGEKESKRNVVISAQQQHQHQHQQEGSSDSQPGEKGGTTPTLREAGAGTVGRRRRANLGVRC